MDRRGEISEKMVVVGRGEGNHPTTTALGWLAADAAASSVEREREVGGGVSWCREGEGDGDGTW